MSVTYAGTTEPVRQILHHHAVLRRGLEQSVAALCAAVESGVGHERELSALRDFLAGEILPHAAAEESTLYPAAVTTARGSELVTGLTAEHRDLAGLVGRLASDTAGRERATVAEWIATLFAGHVAKENDLLLPALTEAGADLADLLARMHDAHKVVRRPASVAAAQADVGARASRDPPASDSQLHGNGELLTGCSLPVL